MVLYYSMKFRRQWTFQIFCKKNKKIIIDLKRKNWLFIRFDFSLQDSGKVSIVIDYFPLQPIVDYILYSINIQIKIMLIFKK